MASRIDFSVRMIPIASVSAGENAAVDTIGTDIGKSLGGSASVTTSHTTLGYTAGEVVYGEAPASGDSPRLKLSSDATGYDFVFIKNTGFQYGTATVLGPLTDNLLDVYLEVTANSTWRIICSLPGGGAMILPNFPSQGIGLALHVRSAGSDTIAVEYILST